MQQRTSKAGAEPTVHMVGNAHIDAAWLWRMSETHDVVWRTFRSALDRMNEYPAFCFTQSQVVFYRWMEQFDPVMLGEIGKRVQEGRWNLVGGWWVEPDANVPSGESFVRQALLGQRYFQSRFGRVATVGFLPDSFGHIATLPQILARSGGNCFVFSRPGRQEKPGSPDLFWWQSPDGSRVLGIRLVQHYCTSGEAAGMQERILEAACEYPEAVNHAICFYGVGDHGGGPTKENIEAIISAGERKDAPRILFSTPDAFTEAVLATEAAAGLPLLRDELQHHARGCYSVLTWIKQTNRELELLMMQAEAFSAFAAALGSASYPHVAFQEAWEAILFNQFHDVLAGTSIPEVYDDSAIMYDGARQTAAAALHDALGALAQLTDTRGGDAALVVFNPYLVARIGPVEVGLPEGATLANAHGELIPLQRLNTGRALFVAEVPGLGYQSYQVKSAESPLPRRELKVHGITLENEWWRLEASPHTGGLARLLDKRNNREVFRDEGGAIPIVIDDPTDTWGHTIIAMRDEGARPEHAEVTIIEEGPVRATIRTEATAANSAITQQFAVYADTPAIEVRCTVDWREQRRALKLAFPVNVAESVSTYGIPFGSIVRDQTGNEEPGQMWLDVAGRTEDGRQYGLSILTVAKYGYDVLNAEARVTILRSPPYAFHDPRPFDPTEDHRFIDQGLHTWRYGLLPHAASWQEAGTVQRAWELALPLLAVPQPAHDGPLGAQGTLVEVSTDHVALSAVKRAEESDDVVVRLYETDRRAGNLEVSVRLRDGKVKWSGQLGAAEIKTLRFPAYGRPPFETDLLERPV